MTEIFQNVQHFFGTMHQDDNDDDDDDNYNVLEAKGYDILSCRKVTNSYLLQVCHQAWFF